MAVTRYMPIETIVHKPSADEATANKASIAVKYVPTGYIVRVYATTGAPNETGLDVDVVTDAETGITTLDVAVTSLAATDKIHVIYWA